MTHAFILINVTFGHESIDSIQYGTGARDRAMQEAAMRGLRVIRVLVKTALTLKAGQALPNRYIKRA